MTSGYHCSKISGSKQSFLKETAIWIVERWKKSLGYRFVPECNHAQEYMSTFSLFSVISAGLGFVEIQKPWQPRQRDVTTSPLLSSFSAKMHSRPQCLRVWECARKICLLYMPRRALGRDWPKWHSWFTRAHYWVLRKSRSRSSPHLRPHLHRLNMFNWTRFWKMKNRLD